MSALSPTAVARSRKWDVIHACDNARQVADLLDAQATANIRAYVLSRPRLQGDSLLQSWNEVRKWRAQLDEHSFEPPFDSAGLVVHAHSFTAGMAAIRGEQPAVYDISAFIDQTGNEPRNWLARSFRAAEQFVLSQAAAVIVHSTGMKQACASRGVAAERLFLVPAAARLFPECAASNLRTRLAIGRDEVVICSEVLDPRIAEIVLASTGSPRRLLLLGDASLISGMPQSDPLAQRTIALSMAGLDEAISVSDVVIAESEHALLVAMLHGKPTLALDGEATRAISPDGAGLLWFAAEDVEDRARRLTRLLEQAEFRRSLGDAARRYITTTRSLDRVGKMYEEVYRFAAQQKSVKTQPPSAPLLPVAAQL